MSRGPGRIERAIASILDADPDNAFTTEELCERVYHGVNRVEKKHGVAVLRAAYRLMDRRDTLRTLVNENLGQTIVFFDCTNVMSYAMARLKCDWPRVHRSSIRDEQMLRAELSDERRRYREYIAPGGAWWGHVQTWIAELEAERAGDTKRLDEIRRKRKDENLRLIRALGGSAAAQRAVERGDLPRFVDLWR
jgi:hypothetical protein